jgi:hypothetical protein
MNPPQLSMIIGNDVQPTVEALWDKVFQYSEVVLEHSRDFGFEGMHQPQPNIHQLVLYVGLLEGAIDVLTEDANATPEEIRLMLNSRRRLGSIKAAAKALIRENQEDFDAAIKDLENVAPF